MNKISRSILTVLVFIFFFLPNIQAQLSEEELAKVAQNPLANLMSFPFQNNINTGIGPYNRTQNVFNFQPILPFSNGKLITRTIIPLVRQPDIFNETGSTSGIGDINLTAFYTSSIGEVNLGIGSILNIPTAKENLGIKEWGLGPSFVAVVKPGNFVMGALVNNVWSLESDKVSSMLIQLFINYNLPNGTYLTTAPAITANWKAEKDDRWTIPFGLGVGKIIKLGGQIPLNIQTGAYYNVLSPELTGADWSFKIGATLLLPTSIFKKK